MLNRSAVVVRPKQPFVDWLKSVEELDVPEITLAQLDKTLYVVPDCEDPEVTEKVLKKVYDDIFCNEQARESLISRKTGAEVPLTGLSFGGQTPDLKARVIHGGRSKS